MADRSANTRERILDAATLVFSRRGFKAATVREICRVAGVGIALINYHFGDKQNLYLAVLDNLLSTGLEQFPLNMGLSPEAPAEERLRAFVRSFILRLVGDQRDPDDKMRGRLIAREIAEPSEALGAVIEKHLKRQKDLLVAIVVELLGPDKSAEEVHLCALSVAGQCLHYVYAWPVIERLDLSIGHDGDFVERVAGHIAEFSLGGMERVKQREARS